MNISQYDYYCPNCDEILSTTKQVVFDIIRNNNEKAQLFLDPKPGSYNFECKPPITFKKGEMVDFTCPHCHQNLESKKYPKFIQINLKVAKGVIMDVFFSRIYGVRKTYVGIEDFEEEYGEEMENL